MVFICREKAPSGTETPWLGPCRASALGRTEPFAAFPGRRARRARWAKHSADSVPCEMVFADTICIAVSDLDCRNARVSPPLGSCPGFAGSVPRNTRSERELRAFSSCCVSLDLPACDTAVSAPSDQCWTRHVVSSPPQCQNTMDCTLESTLFIHLNVPVTQINID